MPLPDQLYNSRFAQYIESIKVMYLVDDSFKTICDEYCQNEMSIENYDKKIGKQLRHKLEAENLSKELEEEILFYIVRKG